MVEKELQRIDRQTVRAIRLIEQGNLKGAAKISASLRRTWAVLESERAMAVIDGYMLLTRRKPRQAKELCLSRMYYLWNFRDALYIIRQAHEPADPKCVFFEVILKGGSPRVGMDEDKFCSFLVLASEEIEAANFVQELAGFSRDDSFEIEIIAKESVGKTASVDNRGVYLCSPFSSSKPDRQFLGEGLDLNDDDKRDIQ